MPPLNQDDVLTDIFAALIITMNNGNIVRVLTDPNSTHLRAAIEDHCQKEFSSENWDFLVAMQKLNNQQNITHSDITRLIELYVKSSAEKQLNLPTETKNDILAKLAKFNAGEGPPLQLSDLSVAAFDIVKLMNRDTLPRAMTKASVVQACKEDHQQGVDAAMAKRQEAAFKPNKIELQLTGLEVLADLNQYLETKLKDLPARKNSIFDFIIKKKDKCEQPFAASQSIIKVMRDELADLLINSEQMKYAEFKKSYDAILDKNKSLLDRFLKDAEKAINKLPVDSLERKQMSEQVDKLKTVISSMYLKFTVNPTQIAGIKEGDIAERAEQAKKISIPSVTKQTNENSISSNHHSITR